ncbi:hypothetical protein D3C71_1397770 [compost metagenome]
MIIGIEHHFTTELPGTQLLKCCIAPEQHAQAIGAVELVAGEHIEIAAQRLHVVATMDHALGAVDHGQGVVRLGQCQQFRQRLPCANHVGQLADRQQTRAWADQAGGGFKVDHAVGIQRQDHQFQVATVRQLLPRQQVGVMLQGADDNLVARIEKMFQAIGQEIQRGRRAVGKDDLPAIASIEPLRDFAAAVLERLGGVGAGQMLRPMHVGRAVGVVVRQGIEQGLRFLRGGGVVQIGLVLPLQGGDGRKIGTPGGENHHAVRPMHLIPVGASWLAMIAWTTRAV